MTKLKDIPKFDRPREKFLEKGSDALTDSELLAILLGSGIKGTNVKVLAQKILKKFGDNLLNASVDDLTQISGIGQAKALQISSALALTRRIFDKQNSLDNLILSARDAIAQVSDLKDKKQEHLICLFLNARNALLKKETISIGILDKSIIHPREIFAPGLEIRAAGVILIHNHPSGDSNPSRQDKQVAKRIIEAGQLMGVNVIDFIIIAKTGAHSVLGEIKNTELTNTDYVADGSQASLFDLLTDTIDFGQEILKKQNTLINIRKRVKKENNFSFVDLFAGIGGFRFALEDLGGECVFSSEWDKNAQKTYAAWFGDMPYGDIRKIKPSQIPSHDVLAAGFPCQPFSIAGVSKKKSLGKEHGFKDKNQGNLFFYLATIIEAKKPPILFLENVKNLKSHNKGETWKIILETLENLGYKVFDQIYDAAHWVPQHRERVFIVCFYKKIFGENPPFRFPDPPKKGRVVLSDILDREVSEKYTLTHNLWNFLQGYAKKHKEKGNGFGFGMANPEGITRTLSARYYKDGSEILIYQGKNKCPRRLTPNECKKLMGFPEDKNIVVSDTQAYRQFGNAVVVPAIRAVAEEMIKTFKSVKSN